MGNILIIKTGAAGDVVRTTSLLNILEGTIYWATAEKNKRLLPVDMDNLKVLSIKEAFHSLNDIQFDQVISLEEEDGCARLAAEITTAQLTGIYFNDNKICYTDDSSCWFDMSRVSGLGMAKANELKAQNRESYQALIFKMLGKKFTGEPYRIFSNVLRGPKNRMIGIEKRNGKQWPDKNWWGYDELISKLQAEGIQVKTFEQRKDIRDYLADIAECSHIVSGDTLAMHVAMAYKKTATAIFNCTSPQEIYDYGLLTKLVSPLLDKYFYSSSTDEEVIRSIPLEQVYRALPVKI